MNPFFEVGSSVALSELSSGIDYAARSPVSNGPMSGTPLEGLLAAAIVLIFMTVALLKPEWMG